MQTSPELLDMLHHMKACGFKVRYYASDHNLAIDVEKDDVPLKYISTADDDEATIFTTFAAHIADKYGWDDDDLYESKMRERLREARTEVRSRPTWDQADVDRVAKIAKTELQGAKDRGQHTEYLFLSPEKAEDLLLRHHKIRRRRGLPDPAEKKPHAIDIIESTTNPDYINQRKQSKSHMKGLSGIIERGDFMLTHQGAAVDPEGFIFDGLQRIQTCAEGNYPIAIEITWNANKKTMPAVDTGKPRLLGDVLSIYGVPNPTPIGQATRLLYNIDNHPSNFIRWNDKHDPLELTNIFSEHYIRVVESYKVAADAVKRSSNRLSPVALAAAHFLITRKWPTAPVEPFIRSIKGPFPDPFYSSRYNTHYKQENFPILKLIDWAAQDELRAKKKERRSGAMGQVAPSHFMMIMRAWNHAANGKTVEKYTWVDIDSVPEIIGIEDSTH
jgi:hypothetical protein